MVPCVAWKTNPDAPGIIRAGFMARASGTPAERVGNGKNPLGNGWNGWNESDQLTPRTDRPNEVSSYGKEAEPESVPAVPSVPHRGFGVTPAIPGMPSAVPVGSGADAMADEDDPHWPPRPANDW